MARRRFIWLLVTGFRRVCTYYCRSRLLAVLAADAFLCRAIALLCAVGNSMGTCQCHLYACRLLACWADATDGICRWLWLCVQHGGSINMGTRFAETPLHIAATGLSLPRVSCACALRRIVSCACALRRIVSCACALRRIAILCVRRGRLSRVSSACALRMAILCVRRGRLFASPTGPHKQIREGSCVEGNELERLRRALVTERVGACLRVSWLVRGKVGAS